MSHSSCKSKQKNNTQTEMHEIIMTTKPNQTKSNNQTRLNKTKNQDGKEQEHENKKKEEEKEEKKKRRRKK